MHNKRQCPETSQNPTATKPPSSQMDDLLETFLSLSSDTSSSSLSLSIDLSFDRLLDSRTSDADQAALIHRALSLGSSLLEAAKRSARKRASSHNSLIWALPPDLTIKVFSMLDTQSVCYVAAACSMFRKCAMDPLCYADIDLRTVVPKVNNAVVSTMLQRARKSLRSLKLGIVPSSVASAGTSLPLVYTARNSVDFSSFSWNDKKTRQGKESCVLTRSCLNSLMGDGAAAGSLLRKLHLYNIERMDSISLCEALSACPSLLDLEVVGLHVELRQMLSTVSDHCHLIERLFFESSKAGRDDSLKLQTCTDLVNSCPNLASLALRGFKLHDSKVRILIKGFHKLKYIDFSSSYSITGSFLRSLGSNTGGALLEVLRLRDCMHLKEVEVARFFTAILAGDYKFLKHVDISNREGLASEGDWYNRCYNTNDIPMKQLSEVRPDICLLAEFPSEGSFVDIEQWDNLSLPSQLSSHSSDGLSFLNTSESSYNSDQGSGNEGNQDVDMLLYEESSDEIDFLI